MSADFVIVALLLLLVLAASAAFYWSERALVAEGKLVHECRAVDHQKDVITRLSARLECAEILNRTLRSKAAAAAWLRRMERVTAKTR